MSMEIGFLLKGIVIGFSIAAPVGPIGILCIRRTLAEGYKSGLAAGLGAATADAIYGCIAGLGLTFISGLLIEQQMWLRLVGGGFLCYLGMRTFVAPPVGQTSSAQGTGVAGSYFSTFFLTLTNPMTILSFAAIFAGMGVASAGGDYAAAGTLVMGVFAGSALWWLTLSSSVNVFRARVTPRVLQWVNKGAGVIIVGFGVLAWLGLKG